MNNYDHKAKTWDQDPQKVLRAQRIADRIGERCVLSANISALEYGCGTGLLSFALRDRIGHVTLVDSSRGMLDVLRTKIQDAAVTNMSVVQLNLMTDQMPEERYDLIYTLMTLHHINNLPPLFTKLYALLNPGGHLCIADLDKEDGSFHGESFDGYNGFDQQWLSDLLHRTGFSDISSEICFTLHKTRPEGDREYEIFLMIGKKPKDCEHA